MEGLVCRPGVYKLQNYVLKIPKMAPPAVKKQQKILPAKAAEKDKEENFLENKKRRHNQSAEPLQGE